MITTYRSPYLQSNRPQFGTQQDDQIQGTYQNVSFTLLNILLYALMIFIGVVMIATIVAVSQNEEQNQITLLCVLLLLIQITLFGCTVYMKLQFSETLHRYSRIPQEIQLNPWFYKSTFQFFFGFTETSQFTVCRLIQVYCSMSMLLLISNITVNKFYSCEEKNQNRQSMMQEMIDCEKNESDPKFIGPSLYALGILCFILSMLFLFQEIGKVVLRTNYRCARCFENCNWPDYQFNDINLNIPKTKFWSKIFCLLFVFNSLGKIIALAIIFTLTPNDTTQILIVSNLFYHAIIILFSILVYIISTQINDSEQKNAYMFVNHQILIDLTLKSKTAMIRLLQIFLFLSLIFTAVGTYFFQAQMDTTYVVINYDRFIFYDCSIAQLILIGLALIKYLVQPLFIRDGERIIKYENQVQLGQVNLMQAQQQQIPQQEILQCQVRQQQVLQYQIPLYQVPQYQVPQYQVQQQSQAQQIQTVEQQSVLLPLNQVQQQTNLSPTNYPVVNDQANLSNQQKIESVQTTSGNFIFQVQLKQKMDCTICMQQLVQYSANNRIVQLKCRDYHIFHLKCIEDWLNKNNECPICKTQF